MLKQIWKIITKIGDYFCRERQYSIPEARKETENILMEISNIFKKEGTQKICNIPIERENSPFGREMQHKKRPLFFTRGKSSIRESNSKTFIIPMKVQAKSIREENTHCLSTLKLKGSVQEDNVHLAIRHWCTVEKSIHYCLHRASVLSSLIQYTQPW